MTVAEASQAVAVVEAAPRSGRGQGMVRLVAVLLGVLLGANPTAAREVSTSKMIVVDNAVESRRQIVLESRDPSIHIGEAFDPHLLGTSVHVYSDTDDLCVRLPAGESWKGNARLWRFRDRVTRNKALLRGGSMKILLKSDIAYSLADDGAQGTVNARVRFGSGTGFCLRCDTARRDDARQFKAKACAAVACDPAPSTCEIPTGIEVVEDAAACWNTPQTPFEGGVGTTLRACNGCPEGLRPFLKFVVEGVVGRVVSAKLRIYVTDPTDIGFKVKRVLAPVDDWVEEELTWDNMPTSYSATIYETGALASGWQDLELAGAGGIDGDGVYTFVFLHQGQPDFADPFAFGAKEGGRAAQLLLETDDVPAAPTGLVATTTTTDRIHVDWDDAAGVSSWSVTAEAAGAATLSAVVDAVTDPSEATLLVADPATTYTVSVVAAGPGGSSPPATASATTAAVLAAPTGLAVTQTSTSSITIDWQLPDDDLHRTSLDFFVDGVWVGWTADENATSHTFSGLSPGTTYALGVKSINQPNDPNYAYLDWPQNPYSALAAVAGTTEAEAGIGQSAWCQASSEAYCAEWPWGFVDTQADTVFAVNGVNLRDAVEDNWHYDVSRLAQPGAPAFNALRVALNWPRFEKTRGVFDPAGQHTAWDELDALITQAAQLGFKVILDPIHVRKQGRTKYDQLPGSMWNLPGWAWDDYRPGTSFPPVGTSTTDLSAEQVQSTWNDHVDDILEGYALPFLEEIMARYGNSDDVIAVDLVNEPRNYGVDVPSYQVGNQELFDMQIGWVDALRALDPDKILILTPLAGSFDPACIDFSAADPALRPNLMITLHDYFSGDPANGDTRGYRSSCLSVDEQAESYAYEDAGGISRATRQSNQLQRIDAWRAELDAHELSLFIGEYGYETVGDPSVPNVLDALADKYALYESANSAAPLARTAWVAAYDANRQLYDGTHWVAVDGVVLGAILTGGSVR